MELERALVVTKLAFSERAVVIIIVVQRLSDKILHDMSEAAFSCILESLLDNVNDAILLHWPDSRHHTSQISEPGLAEGLLVLQGFRVQLYADLLGK